MKVNPSRHLSDLENRQMDLVVNMWHSIMLAIPALTGDDSRERCTRTVEGSALQTLYVSFCVATLQACADSPEHLEVIRDNMRSIADRLRTLADTDLERLPAVAQFLSTQPDDGPRQ